MAYAALALSMHFPSTCNVWCLLRAYLLAYDGAAESMEQTDR